MVGETRPELVEIFSNAGGAATLVVDGDLGSLDIRARGELDRLAEPTNG